MDPPLVLFLLSAVLGVVPAYDRSLCWPTLITLVGGFLLYVLISRLGVSPRWWRAFAGFIVLTGALLALYFVTQYAHFDIPEKIGAIDHLGELIGRIVPPLVVWVPWANGVGAFLEGGLFLAVALALTEKRRFWRIGSLVGAGLIALGLLMSASRGAWLAVAVASTIWLALHWRPARVLAIAGGVLALGLILYVVVQGDITVLGRIPIVDRTLAPMFIRPDRLDIYRNSLYLIQDFPLTGVGLGETFAMVLSRYALLIRVPFLTYSHNLYLEVWLEQGLLGILAWLWLMAAIYRGARMQARLGADVLVQATWLGLTAIFAHGVSDACPYAALWCWAPFFGLLGLNGAILLRRPSADPGGRGWIFPAGVMGAFLIGTMLFLHPLPSTWQANLGCVFHARADLLESLGDERRVALQRQAAQRYRRAIRIAPRDRTARQRLGLLLMDDGRFEEAVEHLEVARRTDPDNTTTHKALGLAYVWVGELEKAASLLRDMPDIVEELNVWGWWRGTQQQMDLSLNAYRTSLLLQPDQPRIREIVGQLEGENLSP